MRRGASGSLRSLRELNRERVVRALRELGVASRAEIARRTGLSRSTVSSLVADLKDEGLIVERAGGRDPSGAAGQSGRPPVLIGLRPSAGVVVGIDFGKRHLAVAASDLSHQVLAESWRDMPEDYTASDGMDVAAELVEAALDEAGGGHGRVLGVGLGLPGPIHRLTGMIGSPAILPGWVGIRVAEEMAMRLSLPIHVDNDANLGALSEFLWGAGRASVSLAYLKVATGIGAGLVVDGRLFHGAGGTAGEIGHTTIDENGPICRCGRRGCLETFAAGPALLELLRPSLGPDLTLEGVLERAADGDPGCQRAIADAGRHIGQALGNLCNLINPELIVVGGSLGAAGDVVLDPIREAVERAAIPSAAGDVDIVPGVLGERAELLGAIGLVLHEVDDRPARRAGDRFTAAAVPEPA
jgi:predicted NBD/HSP70 family sugar kinase